MSSVNTNELTDDSCKSCFNCFDSVKHNVIQHNPINNTYTYTIYHNGLIQKQTCKGCNNCYKMYIYYLVDIELKNKVNPDFIKIKWGFRYRDTKQNLKIHRFPDVNKMKTEVSVLLGKLGYSNIEINKCKCNAPDCYTYIATFGLDRNIDEIGH
jgi:hypothetical protein